jgi:hypothetical protein
LRDAPDIDRNRPFSTLQHRKLRGRHLRSEFARSDASAVRPRRGNADRGRWCDANVVAWNIANEDRACGYARAHNSNPYPACGKGGPLRLICAEKATLEVRDIDRFRACGRCGERQNCNQQKLPGSHRPAPFSWTTHSTGRAVRACAKLRHRPTKIKRSGDSAHRDRGGRAPLIGKQYPPAAAVWRC